MPPYLTTNNTAPVDFTKVQQNPTLTTQYPQTAQPVTTLSSVNGQQIATQNNAKLAAAQQSIDFTFDPSKETAAEYTKRTREAIAAKNPGDPNNAPMLRAPINNPAQAQTINGINQGIQSGGATPQNISSYSSAMDLQGNIFNDISLADAAKQSGNYSQMDYLIKRSEENTKLLNDQLAQLYKDMKPLREKQLQLMTPGAREQELAKQVNNIKGQVDQFKIQTEEDKFREFEGQTLGFAGGRASEIDIRAQFKLQRMAAEQNTLLTELGLEQSTREMEGKSVEQQLSWIADDFELQQSIQDKITESEDKVFDAAKDLRGEAKDTLSMILDSMKGINPDQMPAQTRMQLQTLAAQSGVPIDVIMAGLKVQNQRQVFEDALKTSQETRLSGGGGTGGGVSGGGSTTNGGYQAGQLTALLKSKGMKTDDAFLKALYFRATEKTDYVNDNAHNALIYKYMGGKVDTSSVSRPDPKSNYTAISIPAKIQAELMSDIEKGLPLKEIIKDYPDVSASYVTSLYNATTGDEDTPLF